jgi:predicted TIM-barrel fold metal-dependent hydrolase
MDPVRKLLTQWPRLLLILAHLGAPDITDAIALAREFGQLRLDTAMVLVDGDGYSYGEPLLSFLAEAEDRILFGSDFPSFPHDYAAQVRGLVNSGLGDGWLRAVLWSNAARLFER